MINPFLAPGLSVRRFENQVRTAEKDKRNSVSMKEIEYIVCDFFGCDPSTLQGKPKISKSRKRSFSNKLAEIRHLVMYFTAINTTMNQAQIVAHYGINRTNVTYCHNTVNNLKDSDKAYLNNFNQIAKLIQERINEKRSLVNQNYGVF